MEILFIIAAIAIAVGAYKLGEKEGEDKVLREIKKSVQNGMDEYSAFARTYGKPGFYFNSIYPRISAVPLVVTSSASFLKLAATDKAGHNLFGKELDEKVEKLSDSYFLAIGWSAEKIADIKELNKNIRGID